MNIQKATAREYRARCHRLGQYRTVTQYFLLLVLLGFVIYSFLPFRKAFDAVRIQEDKLGEVYGQFIEQADKQSNVIRSLSLAPSRSEFTNILLALRANSELINATKEVIAADNRFVRPYTGFFICFALFAYALAFHWVIAVETERESDQSEVARQATTDSSAPMPYIHAAGIKPQLFVAITILAILGLAYFDAKENGCLISLLTGEACSAADLRFFAQTKFLLIGCSLLPLLLMLGIGIRRELRFWTRGTPSVLSRPGDFEQLLASEYTRICIARGDHCKPQAAITFEAAQEPRVSHSNLTFVGLALSGGGIRSAIFNLGVLQALHRFGLLQYVDYLSTVSGGGYIGGFWSRWLQNSADTGNLKGLFPDRLKEMKKSVELKNFGGDSRVFESDEIRHIREFSNFLFPRVGFFDTETWAGAVALVAAILPALATALSVLGLSLIVWLGLTFYMACSDAWARVAFLVGATLLTFVVMEAWWRASPTGDRGAAKELSIFFRSVIALVLVGWLAWKWQEFPISESVVGNYSPTLNSWYWQPINSTYEDWWKLLGIVKVLSVADDAWTWTPRLYEPSLIWAAVAALFILFRFRGVFSAASMRHRVMLPTNDRVTMRLLGVAVLWAVLATFWHIGLNLTGLTYVLAGGAAGSAGLFTLLRNWIGRDLARPRKPSKWQTLKVYAPQLLAYLTIGLAWAALASALMKINGADWFSWYVTLLIMAGIVLLVLLVDPHEFGLHSVYRDRICRAFLGAVLSAPKTKPSRTPVDGNTPNDRQVVREANDNEADDNRQTEFRNGDDIELSSLLPRPLQLICCAANNIAGDHLATLSRGARSAILSRYGLAMGNDWVEQPALTLGSAITASAAATNSNMGSASMRVGPAVSFLMSALNLRLGLWVGHPRRNDRDRQGYILPGWRFFKEMAGWTTITGREIHLSDGGHFDNLGLYELVRRHCRYVVVSDATADPNRAFDDIGNTIRRIREDFGVEIEIDLQPLKPSTDGRGEWHAAVGAIDYGPFDKGILIYIKPSLTGDEPADIVQYSSRNTAFPHEGTTDQFYDEAQWESYRRLGVHMVNEIFEFVERVPENESNRIQKIFEQASQTWHPTPPGLAEQSVQIARRFSILEQQFKSAGTMPMLPEVFPEMKYMSTLPNSDEQPSAEHEFANIACLMSVMALMEEAVLSCHLATHLRHPINLGWTNLFARWATAPTFQRWWPLLKPMYGPGLRDFLEDRFEVLREAPLRASASISISGPKGIAQDGFGFEWWQQRYGLPELRDLTLYHYTVIFPGRNSHGRVQLQLALVAIRFEGTIASWTSDHFFVPVSLWGSRLAHHFLHLFIERLKSNGWEQCVVKVKGPSTLDNNKTKWDERQSFVNFYLRAGFRLTGYEEYEEATPTGGTRKGLLAILSLNCREAI